MQDLYILGQMSQNALNGHDFLYENMISMDLQEPGAFLALRSGCGPSLTHFWLCEVAVARVSCTLPPKAFVFLEKFLGGVRQMRATASLETRKRLRIEPQTIFEASFGFWPPLASFLSHLKFARKCPLKA